jgi:hypothetical protein|tara:strand:+ start:49608 stop:49844 length:237 start_codon:yes stop_codon:yes gene_type:complete
MNNNKLIAEFMGAEPDKKTFFLKGKEVYFYHTSWDWLMPVVEKIYQLDSNADFFGSINIEATYKEVVEFIKEYNDRQG